MTSIFDYDVDAELARILESQAANNANYANQNSTSAEISNFSEFSCAESNMDTADSATETQDCRELDEHLGDIEPFEGHSALVAGPAMDAYPWGDEGMVVD